MTKQHNITVIAVAAVISAVTSFYIVKNNTKKGGHIIKARVFPVLNGWGYDILVDDSLFIRQESVPVITGKNGFSKKEYAEKTAELIINKMKRGEHPVVTTFELEHILSVNKLQHDRSGATQ
ncbi:MAG: DUF4907 domain-containing protein [Chitinophagaceae bacterium]|nr:DUF4907 domain-containing protein [Chitinophagaceae bacterium]